MQDLVDAIQINRSSLYNTIGDKHNLFIKCVTSYSETIILETQEIIVNENTALQNVIAIIREKALWVVSCDKGCLGMKSILLTAIGLLFSISSFAQNENKMRSINNNAPATSSKTITINADSKKVWAVLTDIDKWASWNTDINNAKLNGQLKPQTTFDWKTGGAKIHSTLHTVESLKNFGWTGKALGTYAIHNWTLTETNGQTKVFVEESMQGVLVGLFKKSFNKNLENQMQKWLELLKKECEKI